MTGSVWERCGCCPWCWTSLSRLLRPIHSFLQCCNSNWFTLVSVHFGTSSNCWKVWLFVPDPRSSLLTGHPFVSPVRVTGNTMQFQWIIFDFAQSLKQLSTSPVPIWRCMYNSQLLVKEEKRRRIKKRAAESDVRLQSCSCSLDATLHPLYFVNRIFLIPLASYLFWGLFVCQYFFFFLVVGDTFSPDICLPH